MAPGEGECLDWVNGMLSRELRWDLRGMARSTTQFLSFSRSTWIIQSVRRYLLVSVADTNAKAGILPSQSLCVAQSSSTT